MLRPAFAHSFILICLMLLGACAAGGKQDYARLAHQEQTQLSRWSVLENGQQLSILGDLIASSELQKMVDLALSANPSLQQTLLTLRIRQAEYQKVSGEKWALCCSGILCRQGRKQQ